MKSGIWNRVKSAGKILFGYQGYGYDAVQNSRYRRTRGLWPLRSEEVELDNWDRDKLISTLVDMKRNDPVVRAISRLRKTDVVGGGIRPQPATQDEELNKKITELWEDFSNYPEISGGCDMVGLQQEIADSTLFWGDIGVLLLKNGMVQLIEGDRIGRERSSMMRDETDPNKNGVLINSRGRPLAYTVGERVNGSLRNVKRISSKHFLLYYKKMRPQQYRGIPELASSVNSLQDVAEYEATEMISAKVSASLSAVIKRQDSVQFELGSQLPENEQDDLGRLEQFEPGKFHYLEPNEDISTISSNGRPNVDGIDWVMYHLRKVGASVGIPVEMMMSTIGQTSFSASQGLLLQYQSSIEDNQRMISTFLNKIYRWKIAKWAANGDLDLGAKAGNPFAVRWQFPSFRWVNKQAQVAADVKYVQLGAQSLDDIASQFGYTAEAVMRRKAQNIAQAKAIAEEFDLDSWRDLFNDMTVNASANYSDILNLEEDQEPQTQE